MLLYSWQLARTGVAASGGVYVSGWDFIVRMLGGAAVTAVPVAVWVALAVAGGFLVRRRTFWHRLAMAWLAAVVLCTPFLIATVVALATSDGWRGLGVISALIPAVLPLAVLPLYCMAAGFLHWVRRRPETG
jgi:hypothetical protein